MVWLVHAPDGFESTLGALPAGARLARGASDAKRFDIIVLFVRTSKELERRFDTAKRHLAEYGGLWIAWAKKSSGIATDVDDSVVRKRGLDSGLVDNKVCAIDATWSGLRFVVRVRDRKHAGTRRSESPWPASHIRRGAQSR